MSTPITGNILRETWWGCYDKQWGPEDLVREAARHPAKAARKLIFRIVRTGLERGWWDWNTVVLDPFAGAGTTLLACSAYGVPSVGVELEPYFLRMAVGFDCPGITAKDWDRYVVRGRQRRPGVAERFCPACLSPQSARQDRDPLTVPLRRRYSETYPSRTPKPAQPFPPPAASPMGRPPTTAPHHYEGHFERHMPHWVRLGKPVPIMLQGDSRELPRLLAEAICGGVGGMHPYNDEPGDAWRTTQGPSNIGNLPLGKLASVTSPPYADGGVREGNDLHPDRMQGSGSGLGGYEAIGTENIGNLPLGGISSPVYGDRVDDHGRDRAAFAGMAERDGGGINHNGYSDAVTNPPYENSDSPDNLGNQRGETYWDAIALILRHLYDLFPDGGHLAWIVKAFVRDGQRVELPQMTLDLMTAMGWEPVVWIDAMQIGEAEQPALLEGIPARRSSQKSFFRRMAEAKGAPPIDSEVVLVVRKPAEAA